MEAEAIGVKADAEAVEKITAFTSLVLTTQAASLLHQSTRAKVALVKN